MVVVVVVVVVVLVEEGGADASEVTLVGGVVVAGGGGVAGGPPVVAGAPSDPVHAATTKARASSSPVNRPNGCFKTMVGLPLAFSTADLIEVRHHIGDRAVLAAEVS